MTTTGMRDGRLNVAIAGAGMISWHHLVAWRKLAAQVRLIAICDPDRQKANARAQEFGIEQVFEDSTQLFAEVADIGALDVASPRETHAAWVREAASRGIAVLCQKPLTPNLTQSEALVHDVSGRCRMMVHENWRFRPWYRELKRWINAGDLGDLVLARMSMVGSGMLPDETGERPTFVRQPFMQHERQLMIAEVLIHHLDTMRFLCGELRVLSARAANTLSDVNGETAASIFLETEIGAPIGITGTLAAPGHPARPTDSLSIIGRKASAILSGSELRLLGSQARSCAFDLAAGYQASFDSVMAHFVDCLASGTEFETSPQDNLATLRLVDQAYAAVSVHGRGQ